MKWVEDGGRWSALTKSGGPSRGEAGHGADAAPVVPDVVVQSHGKLWEP